ncbi:MAG: putative manganese-dependent inorganic diphosphatase [Erysipelotrichaceae bacterium]|nr:putative manganese-dependent inorganic diphosphatase [Erysipelotrichaceae bacterium]
MKKDAIYITGHKNPDTDSICSAIAYAYLKQQCGENAVAIRIGEVNNETKFVLDTFGVDAPPFVTDIRTRVRDIDFDDVVTIPPTGMLHEAIEIMRKYKKKVIAVVDGRNHLLGMATISDITNTIVEEGEKKRELISHTPISNFAKLLNARLAFEPTEHHMDGDIFIASSTALNRDTREFENRIVVTSARKETQMRAIECGAAVIIATRSNVPSLEVLRYAKEHNCAYMVTEKDMYQTTQLVQTAIPVSLIMTNKLVNFHYDDYVEDVKVAINQSRFRSYPVLDHTGALVGLISRYHLFRYNSSKLILVDHNEMEQSIIGASHAEILEVIDHHRIGGIKTSSPVMFRNELVGCCGTIISRIYAEQGVVMPKEIAGILCGAIISDTLHFHSPTCTPIDIQQARYLADYAGIDLNEFAKGVLQASAEVSDKSPEEIIYNDLKYFEIEKFKVALGQINIMDLDDIRNIREDVLHSMEHLVDANGFHIAVMIFSCVDASGSYLLYTGEAAFLMKSAFQGMGEETGGYLFLPEVLSRKKQIVPRISEAARVYREQSH